MDVEGFEYDVLTQMLREASEPGSKNNLPAQISIELHYGTRMYDLAWLKRWRNAGEILRHDVQSRRLFACEA
jgi:hypothetical protein